MTDRPTVPDTAPWCAAPDPGTRPPRSALPPGSCDCHAHICGPIAQYDYAADRIYTPPDALLSDYRRMLGTLGVERAVLVQPSVYGTDNAVLLGALSEGGPSMRGVAVVDPTISDAELRTLDRAGIRGVRINVVDRHTGRNVVPLDEIVPLARRIEPLGWHVELLLQVDAVPELAVVLKAIPVDVVLGHLGYVHADKGGVGSPGFQALLRVMQTGRCWAKLTGPYRISSGQGQSQDVAAMARGLAEAAPERIVWGTDWPHVMVKGQMPNDGDLCDLLEDWLLSKADRTRILVDNPATLYGFTTAVPT